MAWIVIPILFKFVWRQPGSAFYVRQLRLAHFFIFAENKEVNFFLRDVHNYFRKK